MQHNCDKLTVRVSPAVSVQRQSCGHSWYPGGRDSSTTLAGLQRAADARLWCESLWLWSSAALIMDWLTVWCSGQHIFTSSEDHEERCGPHEEPLQLSGEFMWMGEKRNRCETSFCGGLWCLFQVLEANLSGEMNLKIDTDLVSVTTHFKELGNPPWGERSSEELVLYTYTV